MSHFYTTATNTRGNVASAAAGAVHGQSVWARGWSAGIRVEAHVVDDVDVFDVYANGGSSGDGTSILLGRLTAGGLEGPEWTEATR